MKTVSILIPIHNRLEITKESLVSLFKALNYYNINGNESINFQVIVIDDGSSDDSEEWIVANHKEIILLKGNGNLWWTGAINKGADFAITSLKSDYLILWNNDIFPNLDYFLVLETALNEKNFENVIIGSKIIFKNSPNQLWSIGGYYNRFSGLFKMQDKIVDTSKTIIDCDWQPGMGTLIPVSVIKSLGIRWDENKFPQYHGDSDFTLRCSSKGIRIITHLGLVLSNNTETSGFKKKQDLKDLIESFTTLKSGYNIKIDLRFYSRHGYFPFAYLGMMYKYFLYIGGYIIHSVLKL